MGLPVLLAHWLTHGAQPPSPVRALLVSAATYVPASDARVAESAQDAGDSFAIPAPTPPMAIAARWAAHRFASTYGDTWPAKVLRTLPDLFGARPGKPATRLLELAADREVMGPLGCVLVAALFDWLQMRERARRAWRYAHARWDFDEAFQDLLDLTPSDSWARRWLLGLGRHWRTDAAVAELLPAAARDSDEAAVHAGLRVLWDAGPGADLGKLLAEKAR